MYRLCQHTAGQSFDIQVFYGDQTVTVNERSREFVVEVRPLRFNVGKLALEYLHSLTTTIRPLIGTPRQTALCHSELALRLFVEPWIVNLCAIIQCGEGIQANVYSNSLRGYRKRHRFTFNREDHKPSSSLALDRNSFDLAINWTMKFYFELADALDIKNPVNQSTAITMRRESNAIPSSARFKTWESWLITSFNTSKECLKRSIQSSKDILSTLVIRNTKKIFRSELFKLSVLIVIANRLPTSLPRPDTFLKSAVVQIASLAQLVGKRINLLCGWIQAVFERFMHQRSAALNYFHFNRMEVI
jgi:hypothetical protein